MRKFALLAALAVTISAPIAAKEKAAESAPSLGKKGWDSVKWGMSVKDVLKATKPKGEATDLTYKGDWLGRQQQGVVGETVMLGHTYRVNYYFTPEKSKLSGLTIVSNKKAECDALDGFFVGQLGEGKRTVEPLRLDENVVMSIATREWSEVRDGNAFQFVYVTDPESPATFCRIRIGDPSTNWKR